MQELAEAARSAFDGRDWPRAAELYERLALAVPEHPKAGDWWYDAALAQKFLRNWPEAYRLGIQAAARAPRGAQDPAFWNLGIAATVQRDWATARDAWTGFGLEVPPGDGPIEGDFGRACVRLFGEAGPEVVWVQRLCPTRGRVLNVPFDVSRRYGEIVLHDGEPKGDRVVGDRTFRVFDELLQFEPSDLPTLAVTVTASAAGLEALADRLAGHGYGFEPLASGYVLCACCSEGSVDAPEREPLDGEQRCLIAAPLDRAREVLTAWQSTAAGTWSDLHLAT